MATLYYMYSPVGWLWLIGSLKITVSFAEYSLFYRVFLQKRPVFVGSLRIVATSYCESSMDRGRMKRWQTTNKFAQPEFWKQSRAMICMGLLRLVGCLKIYVSFAKELYKRDLYFAKRPLLWRILLIGYIFVTHRMLQKMYGVATISRMRKNIRLFCKRALQKRPIFCKETYILQHYEW